MQTKNSPEHAMATEQAVLCTVCGEARSEDQVWFLIVQGHWNDTLRILAWDESLAVRKGMHRACCPAHVQELVCQWMATGDLEFLLSPERNSAILALATGSNLPEVMETTTEGGREIAELAVDREGIARVLNDNPDSLLVILDELRDALEREAARGSGRIESAVSVSVSFLRHM